MSESCPISHRRVDAQMVRAISVLISLTAVLFLLTSHMFLAYLLLIDFSLRLFRKNQFSPFFQLSLAILRLLNIQPRMSDEAPKRFALYLGWAMSIMIVVFGVFGALTYATLFIAILLLCATLEMLFEFCVGCKVYQYLQLLK